MTMTARLQRLLSVTAVRSIKTRIESILARFYCVVHGVWDPEILFDAAYYKWRYADVRESGMDSLFHYLRFGAKELRHPHPWFHTGFYTDRYLKGHVSSDVNPLIHFLQSGAFEGRSPHPEFDSTFYLAKYPDVAGHIPIIHFINFGAGEGRLPSPAFDPELYLAAHKDVANAGVNPVWHYARYGIIEGRVKFPSFVDKARPEDFLPARKLPTPEPRAEIDLIVPVYRGFDQTRACIQSIEAANCRAKFRIVVINDSSPEPAISDYLRTLSQQNRITLFENEANIGFVRSVNRGIGLSASKDAVLLNSDTLVFNDWLDRLSACAWAHDRNGTVTPFSNNATICSYPVFCADNAITNDLDFGQLDAEFGIINRGRSVEIPTAVGFCMYIRRDCLNAVGLFDAETFGLGYGEENDFCMRARAAGWRNMLACDVFVYHAGAVSFGKDTALVERAQGLLQRKHPHYADLVRRHCAEDPAQAYRIAVTISRLAKSPIKTFLAVTHSLGGGVAQHIAEIQRATEAHAGWLTLKAVNGRLLLECGIPSLEFKMTVDPERNYDSLVAVLRACKLQRVHVHHTLGHSSVLAKLIGELGVPFEFTVHDYHAICPQVNLADREGRYCSEPAREVCDRCMEARPSGGDVFDITSWRGRYSWLFNADRVIAPSLDVAERMRLYYPEARIVAAEHEPAVEAAVHVLPLSPNEPFRIAVLGVMALHKGFLQLKQCAEIAAAERLPLEFILAGSVESGLLSQRIPFSQTGEYINSDLPVVLKRIAPHIIWFPAQWPETFSYTLSKCLQEGIPVAVPNLGAFPERVAGREWSWIVPWQSTAREWVEFFLQIRQDNFLNSNAPVRSLARARAERQFYPKSYLAGTAERLRSRSSARGRPIELAAILSAHPSGQMQACAYVRVIQPLTHPALGRTLKLNPIVEDAMPYLDCDAVIVQRVSVKSRRSADRLVQVCRERGIRLIYETDDDLIGIDKDHPEFCYYAESTGGARILAQHADAVVVSTENLRQKLSLLNPKTHLMPNYLDDRLWTPPVSSAALTPGLVKFLYMGSPSHRDDLDFLCEAFRVLKRKYGDGVELEVIGVTQEKSDLYKILNVPLSAAMSYPRFVSWIRGLRRGWQWGLAPLLNTPFNHSKSPVKSLEYGGLGLPSICSDMPVYADGDPRGAGRLIVENALDGWVEAMERTIIEPTLWPELASAATESARQNTIAAHAGTLIEFWEEILDCRESTLSSLAGSYASPREF